MVIDRNCVDRLMMRFAIVFFFMCLNHSALCADMLYLLENYSLDPTGRVSGFIRTDGTIGELGAENILDYRIDINGTNGYVFTPQSPGASLSITDGPSSLEATPSKLLGIGTESIRFGLVISATDTEALDSEVCIGDCYQEVSWSHRRTGSQVDFRSVGRTEREPDLLREYAVGSWTSWREESRILIGAAVPEPSTLTLMSMATLSTGVFVRRRRTS